MPNTKWTVKVINTTNHVVDVGANFEIRMFVQPGQAISFTGTEASNFEVLLPDNTELWYQPASWLLSNVTGGIEGLTVLYVLDDNSVVTSFSGWKVDIYNYRNDIVKIDRGADRFEIPPGTWRTIYGTTQSLAIRNPADTANDYSETAENLTEPKKLYIGFIDGDNVISEGDTAYP